MSRIISDVKAKYDRIFITGSTVKFYFGSEMVAEMDAVWDKDNGDTLTISDLDGTLTIRAMFDRGGAA